jgi:hypothetical protein
MAAAPSGDCDNASRKVINSSIPVGSALISTIAMTVPIIHEKRLEMLP